MITVTLHGKNGTRAIAIQPKGFPTRHIRTRVERLPEPPPSEPPVPVCPVLAALHKLTEYYPGGNGYFIFDEIFVTVRQECASFSRDALLETLRGYYRDRKIAFRQGYGSQLQFALKGGTA
ncbi:hypothetical protein C6499_22825 [Candidatus Poribacteria bacterium]|nr:MAG: hypothetical protein C6499_22825 [Candidatus Poribacteria bacterium]